MKSVLMVAEKPSLAASLANILSNGRNSNRKGKENENTSYGVYLTDFFLV